MSGGYSLPCFCDFFKFIFLTPSPDGEREGGGLQHMLYPERGLDSLTQVVSGEVLGGGGEEGVFNTICLRRELESQEAW